MRSNMVFFKSTKYVFKISVSIIFEQQILLNQLELYKLLKATTADVQGSDIT